MKAHHEKIKAKVNMSPIHESCGIWGIMRIQLALIRNLDLKVIQDGFRNTGIYDPKIRGYNISTILGNCTTKFQREEATEIMETIPHLARALEKVIKFVINILN